MFGWVCDLSGIRNNRWGCLLLQLRAVTGGDAGDADTQQLGHTWDTATAFCSAHSLLIPSSSQRENTELHGIRSRFLHCQSGGKILPVTVGAALAATQPPTRAKSHLLLGSEAPQILLSFTSNRWRWLFLLSAPFCSWLPCVGFSENDLCIVHSVLNSLKLQPEKQRTAQRTKREGRVQKEPPPVQDMHTKCIKGWEASTALHLSARTGL